ncbi:MATE family efflux transporter [Halotalea alkalilenta]|uniref:MATE family efflux transporter n=1 Tax=Halotalea alkalilenta TaxID=376489 RepID=A0A172YJ12_9GAMM|nr:MATE family efflux transporter [Halotalea alkalilenta]ANF59176.1 MATE family efflux transporter [Halotalea alkalilenta]
MARPSSPSSPAAAASSHSVWRLAWPIILSNVSVPLLGLIGTAVIGHLPDARYLGAVTLGTTLFSLLFWAFGFLRMGTTGLTSQAHGRSDAASVRALLLQSLALAASIGMVLIVLSPWLIPFTLGLLGGEAEVQALAAEYARIRILSAPAVLANYVVIGWFLGQQNARATLILMVFGNLLNIALTLLLVLGVGLKSDGVAWAALVADHATLALAAWLVRSRGRELAGRFTLAALRGLAGYAALFQVNRHLFVRTLCLLFATAFFTSRGAEAGTTVLAANAVLMQFVMLTSFALDGFAQAAEALTGRAVGARRFDQFAAAVRACARFSLYTAIAAAALFALAGPWMIDLLTGIEEVRATARDYLPWLALMPLIAVWSYLLDGVFIGATETKAMRDTLLLSLAIYLPSWYLLQGFGNHGLWLAFSLFTLTRSVSLGAIYLRRRKGAWRDSA